MSLKEEVHILKCTQELSSRGLLWEYNFKEILRELIFPGKTPLFLVKQWKLRATAAVRGWMEGRFEMCAGQCMRSSAQSPFPSRPQWTCAGVEALRGHRASPIVPNFTTDKHLLMKADQSPPIHSKRLKRRAGNKEKEVKNVKERVGNTRAHISFTTRPLLEHCISLTCCVCDN